MMTKGKGKAKETSSATLVAHGFVHGMTRDDKIGCLGNWLSAQLHYFLNLSRLLVSCLPLLVKLI